MIWPDEVFLSIRDDTGFTVTEEHLKLLRRARVSWDDAEYGAPAIDPKRPYGGSSPDRDMAEILGLPDSEWLDQNGNVIPGAEDRFARLHAETALALQIVLATGEFRPGRYTRTDQYEIDWTRQQR